MKTQFVCPDCQKTFDETQSAKDFDVKCPHCGAEVSIPADPAKAEKARKEAEEKAEREEQEAERIRMEAEQKAETEKRDAEERAKKEAQQVRMRKQDEEDAKAVALMGRNVKRICPHCQHEDVWELVKDELGDEAFVVRCRLNECRKNFTIQLNSSDELLMVLHKIQDTQNQLDRLVAPLTQLTGIIKELEVIRYRIGALVFWFIVIPLLCLALLAIINNIPK